MLNNHFQYSQYSGIVAATPQKSEIPVATIGGEPGGRPPIVVDENIPEPPVDKDQTTTAGFGKAEPGHDVFAGEPQKDIKSDHAVQPPLPADDKEISSVFSQTPSESPSESIEESKAAASPSGPAKPVGETAEFKIQTSPAKEEKEDKKEEEKKEPQGPLDEHAAEADRAAQDLFPDAGDKK